MISARSVSGSAPDKLSGYAYEDTRRLANRSTSNSCGLKKFLKGKRHGKEQSKFSTWSAIPQPSERMHGRTAMEIKTRR
jgi:hypothetical protein